MYKLEEERVSCSIVVDWETLIIWKSQAIGVPCVDYQQVNVDLKVDFEAAAIF